MRKKLTSEPGTATLACGEPNLGLPASHRRDGTFPAGDYQSFCSLVDVVKSIIAHRFLKQDRRPAAILASVSAFVGGLPEVQDFLDTNIQMQPPRSASEDTDAAIRRIASPLCQQLGERDNARELPPPASLIGNSNSAFRSSSLDFRVINRVAQCCRCFIEQRTCGANDLIGIAKEQFRTR